LATFPASPAASSTAATAASAATLTASAFTAVTLLITSLLAVGIGVGAWFLDHHLGRCIGPSGGLGRPARLAVVRVDYVLAFFKLRGGIEKIRDVEERISLKADIDERRLHSGEHAGNASLVDTAGKSLIGLALDIDFYELVIIKDGQTRFVLC
jgi:hypothetical protein